MSWYRVDDYTVAKNTSLLGPRPLALLCLFHRGYRTSRASSFVGPNGTVMVDPSCRTQVSMLETLGYAARDHSRCEWGFHYVATDAGREAWERLDRRHKAIGRLTARKLIWATVKRRRVDRKIKRASAEWNLRIGRKVAGASQ